MQCQYGFSFHKMAFILDKCISSRAKPPPGVALFTPLWKKLDTLITWYDRVGRPSSLKHKQQERTRHQHATTIGEGDRALKTVKTEHDSRGGAQNTNSCTCIQSEDRRVRRGDWTVQPHRQLQKDGQQLCVCCLSLNVWSFNGRWVLH